jgi:hypothetical protein
MWRLLFYFVTFSAVMAAKEVSTESWKCKFCQLGINTFKENALEAKLQNTMHSKCTFEEECEKGKILTTTCEIKGRFQDKICHKAADQVVAILLRKLNAPYLCELMEMCIPVEL